MKNILTPSIAFAVAITAAISAKAGTIIINDDGQYCREYSNTVTVGDRLQTSYGTACQQPDGQWQIQTSDSGQRNNVVIANNNPPIVYQQPPAVIYTQPPVTRYIVRTRPVYSPPPIFYAYRYPQPRRHDRDWDRRDDYRGSDQNHDWNRDRRDR